MPPEIDLGCSVWSNAGDLVGSASSENPAKGDAAVSGLLEVSATRLPPNTNGDATAALSFFLSSCDPGLRAFSILRTRPCAELPELFVFSAGAGSPALRRSSHTFPFISAAACSACFSTASSASLFKRCCSTIALASAICCCQSSSGAPVCVVDTANGFAPAGAAPCLPALPKKFSPSGGTSSSVSPPTCTTPPEEFPVSFSSSSSLSRSLPLPELNPKPSVRVSPGDPVDMSAEDLDVY
mmetsp:Transcript_8251/g.27445  ORF Transcript_8251/g.27445 Transcript_8251/m.27445 type:complete len:240 (+) Transcript_8251:828-1547(+)